MYLLILIAIICGILICLSSYYPAMLSAALAALAALSWRSLMLFYQSRTDTLTGLWNLRRLDDMRRYYSKCSELSVWYFDLDHLKHINDAAGHADGDRMLVAVATALRNVDSPRKMAYRIGGDEFLLILPFPVGSVPPLADPDRLQVSWGFALGPGSRIDELIVRAEQAMYEKRCTNESVNR